MLNYQKFVFSKENNYEDKLIDYYFKLFRELPDVQEKTKERPFQLPYCLKTRTLLHAHIHRLNTLSDNLEKGKNN